VRVLFVVRESADVRSGGDMTQALFTKRAIEDRGVRVDIAPATRPDARGYDLAHVFGVFDPEICALQMAACKQARVPVALSPIWWDLFDFYGRSRACARILSAAPRHIERALARLRATPTDRLLRSGERRNYSQRIALQGRLMREADVLLPNSAIEAHHYVHRLGLHDRPIVVVHHACDVRPENGNLLRSGVFCAGRIEPKKNQAMLLYALRDSDVEITLAGACYEPEYMQLCKRWATRRTRMLGDVPRDELQRLVARAAVHVLPAWAETPGIVNLEAAAAGARVVASNDGTEREYLGESAEYVDPMNPQALKITVERALAMPARSRPDDLDRCVARFTLESVGEKTQRGYEIAIAAKG
jgi:glycosyltransferase involved in cell wall biosynthesis